MDLLGGGAGGGGCYLQYKAENMRDIMKYTL